MCPSPTWWSPYLGGHKNITMKKFCIPSYYNAAKYELMGGDTGSKTVRDENNEEKSETVSFPITSIQ